MYGVPSASAPNVVALQVPERVPPVAAAPSGVAPVRVGSAGNLSVQVSVDSAAPQFSRGICSGAPAPAPAPTANSGSTVNVYVRSGAGSTGRARLGWTRIGSPGIFG